MPRCFLAVPGVEGEKPAMHGNSSQRGQRSRTQLHHGLVGRWFQRSVSDRMRRTVPLADETEKEPAESDDSHDLAMTPQPGEADAEQEEAGHADQQDAN